MFFSLYKNRQLCLLYGVRKNNGLKKKKRGSLIGLSGVKKACIDTRSKGCKQLLWRFLAAVVFVVGRKKGG